MLFEARALPAKTGAIKKGRCLLLLCRSASSSWQRSLNYRSQYRAPATTHTTSALRRATTGAPTIPSPTAPDANAKLALIKTSQVGYFKDLSIAYIAFDTH